MRFAHPYLLVLLLALVPVLGVYAAFVRARREKALQLITAKPGRSVATSIQGVLITVGLVLCCLAAGRPQWGAETVEAKVAHARRNVVVALDVSRSMLAADVHPNRLRRAKSDVADLIDSLVSTDRDGKTVRDRCALVAFRSNGRMVCPLTDDRDYLKQELETVGCTSADPGPTSLGAGISRALDLIHETDADESGVADHSAIILISDGGDAEEREPLLAKEALRMAEDAKKRGVPIFTIGIGDPETPTTVRLPDGTLLRDRRGEPVKVKLETAMMERVAEASGGRYVPFGTAQTGETSLGVIYRDFLRQVGSTDQRDAYERLGERYLWFLLPGLVLLIAGAALSRGRFRRNTQRR